MNTGSLTVSINCIDNASKPLLDTARRAFFLFLEPKFKLNEEDLLK